MVTLLMLILPNLKIIKGQELTWSDPFPGETEGYRAEQMEPLAGGYLLLAKNVYEGKRHILGFINQEMNNLQIHKLARPKNSRLINLLTQDSTALIFYYQHSEDSTFLLSKQYWPTGDSLSSTRNLISFHGQNYRVHLASSSDSAIHGIFINPRKRPFQVFHLNKHAQPTLLKKGKFEKGRKTPSVKELSAVGSTIAFTGLLTDKKDYFYYRLDSNQKLHTLSLFNDSLSVVESRLGYDRVNSQFLVVGLYQLKGSETMNGLAFIRESVEEEYLHYEPFPQRLIKDVFGQETMKEGLTNFKLRGLVPRSDGGAIVFLESYQKDKKVYHDRGYFGTINETIRKFHYYGEVVVMAISPEGHIQWSKVHRKKQSTVNDDGLYSSFSHMVQKNRLIFLYNSISNNTMNLLSYSVTPSGNMKGKLLLKDRYDQLRPVPRKAMQVGPSTMLMPIMKNDRFHLLKLDFSR